MVRHLAPTGENHLAEILSRRTALMVVEARAGERPLAGRVYMAPPDKHLLIGRGDGLVLGTASQEHFVRPSANALFRSAAERLGKAAVAVVLTGAGERRSPSAGHQVGRRHGDRAG